jgi:WD40 repeat protein/DNA-binding SARP family transcriptional activator
MERSPVYRRAVQFRVLGPLEADAGEGPIPLGGRKQRAVLASLLVRANEVVSADALIDDVWGEEPPDTAKNILQTYVANLRKALGDDRLQGRPPGYVLSIGPAELDAIRFDDLVTRAKRSLPVDPNVAIATFEDALALWRGPALADLHEQSSLLAEAARLEELRLDAQEDRIEALLATSANAKALAELEPLLDRHPLRESLWGLAMVASYRDGRQAEALNTFGRARELLADELGIDPSPELVRMHERILKQDPSLELRGEPLRGYRLLERIGAGSVGTVFRGIQPHVGRDVAIKVFDEKIAADPDFVARFEHDAQIVASLEHPHIVPMYDYWREPGRAYVVHRYMRGGSLRALRERGADLDRQRVLKVVAQVASALGFAHRQGVGHGGVHPSNVLLDAEGNAYLSDFKIGTGPAPDPSADLRALEHVSRDLLSNDVPASLGELLDELADGGLGPDAVADAANELLEPRAVGFVRTREDRNPYKGLRAFGEADAPDFFGRSELTTRLVAALNDGHPAARFLALVGPSGGGKSSAVRAGLVPALRGGALATSRPVLVTDMFPGIHPLEELEEALVRVAARSHARLGDLLRSGSRGLLEAVDLVTPEGAELVLIVDQFEELFTLAADERERESILEALRVCALDPHSRLVVIATLRADFYDRPLVYPRFGELLAERNVTVPPLTADELEQAIRRPAEREGMRLEPGLVAEMIADVAHQPGGLPLLQFALTELYERREGDRLTLAAYRDIGGVTGALSARADRLFTAADADGRHAIEQVFLRLVTLGEGRQDTRRRVAIAELDGLDVTDASLSSALDAYGRHRLLTFDREPSTREPTVEIAHEALLRSWGRLASWIDQARDDLRQHERLARAAAEWRGSERDPSFLMAGARLDQVEAWSASTSLSVGQPERAYIKASVDRRDRERDAERIRSEHEAQIERRSVRRLRGLVAVFAVAALVAGTLTIVATNQGSRAEREATISRAREMASAALANLGHDPELGILLAMEAVDVTRSIDGSVLPEAEDALHRAVTSSRVVITLPGVSGPVASSADGIIATTSQDALGTVDLRDLSDGHIIGSIDAHAGEVVDLVFSRDGDLLATSGRDGALKMWSAPSGEPLWTLQGEQKAEGISFNADGSLVAATWSRSSIVRVLDTASGGVVQTIPLRAGDTSLSASGDQVALAGKRIHVIDVRTAERVFRPVTPSAPDEPYAVDEVAWSPDGSTIAASNVAALDILEPATGELRFSTQLSSQRLAWSPDSRTLAVSSGGVIKIWELGRDGDVQQTISLSATEMTTGIATLTFGGDGTYVMATSEGPDAALKVWDVGLDGTEEIGVFRVPRYFGDVEFAPDGRTFLTAGMGGRVEIFDTKTLRSLRTIGASVTEQFFDLSADGEALAEVDLGDRKVTAWNVATGTRMFRFMNPGPSTGVEWSPDGRYLVVSGGSGSGARVLDRSGRVVLELAQGQSVDHATFSPDGALIATRTGGAEIWDARTGASLGSFPGRGCCLAFDPSGTRIVTSGDWGTPAVWDARTGQRQFSLESDEGDVCFVMFSPDGSRIAVGGDDDTTRMFDAATGEQQLVLRGTGPTADLCVRSVSFSPDGSMLATQNPGRLRIWALDIDALLDIARNELTRSLTDEECRQYLRVDRCPTTEG